MKKSLHLIWIGMLLIWANPLLAADCNVASVSVNQTLSGTLSASDCRISDILSTSDGSRVDVFSLNVQQAGLITISLESTEFDPFLRLLTDNLSALAEDDDSGTGFNAEISMQLGVGSYRILANSATSSEETGNYSLSASDGNSSSTASRLVNISTRALVNTGDGVTIGGFIIAGTQSKTVIVRALGPELANRGVSGVLLDPQLQLFKGSDLIDSNDDWNNHARKNEIPANLVPNFQLETAIVATLEPGAYTAIVRGNSESTGVGLIEVFELTTGSSRFRNISTRGAVGTGDDVMIGGLVISGDTSKTVLIRAKGPSLTQFGVPGALQDPNLQLFSGASLLDTNDDWQSHANANNIPQNLRPDNAKESAILVTLQPGPYTAIVRGTGETTGIGLVEVFEID